MPPSALEDLAARCVPGEGPVALQSLGSGLVNETYRVARAGATYSLRMPAPHAQDLGLDRSWECRVLETAGAAGFAPGIAHCDPAAGILVADWVRGDTWTPREAQAPEALDAMARLLRQVHSLPLPASPRRMSPAGWIAHYERALARRGREMPPGLAELRSSLAVRLQTLAAAGPVEPVLCHGDLHRLNVLTGKRSVLLDWEYAHVSDPFWDLAGWIANNDWPEDLARRLTASYLQRSPEPEERIRLEVLTWLYDHVCLLWSELYLSARSGHAARAVATRAKQLEARLRRGFSR